MYKYSLISYDTYKIGFGKYNCDKSIRVKYFLNPLKLVL